MAEPTESPFAAFAPLRVVTPGATPSPAMKSTGTATCPTCDGRPALERFPRLETITYEPLLYCARCYGFWARGDSLSRGAADPHSEHPALRQVPIEPRCKACFGPLDGELVCRKCQTPLQLIPCPACGISMTRARQDGVLLDACSECNGVWFETGELPRMLGLTGYPPTLLERIGPPPAIEDDHEPAGWGGLIADLVALALRFAV